MAGAAPKKYGLIVPPKKSKGVPAIKKPSVFEESSSDEEVRVKFDHCFFIPMLLEMSLTGRCWGQSGEKGRQELTLERE